ncbi:MAG: phosphotransferase [candidate division KSB1 bacterium]|nr:phosphotransferase [candidate division KSB1 bacterium]
MSADTPQVRQILLHYWHVADWRTVPSDVRDRVQMEIRSDGIVAHIPAFGDIPAAFLKIYSGEEALRNEIEGLQQAGLVSAQLGVSVPRVVEVLPAANALLFNHLPGTVLGVLLRQALLRPNPNLQTIWQRLAWWLRAFHDARILTPKHLPGFVGWWTGLTEKYLSGVADLIGADLEQKVSQVINAIVRSATVRPISLVMCHGDFALHNVIVNKVSIYVTDFAYRRPAPRELDIERFFHSVEDCIGFFPTSDLRVHICSQFTADYGTDYVLDETASDAFRLLLQLERLFFLSKSRGATGSPLKRIWRSYQFRKSLLWFRDWLEAASTRYVA